MTLLLQGAGIQVLTVAPSGPVPLLDLEADTGLITDTTPFAGTGTITQSGTTVTGDGSDFAGEITPGDRITAAGIDGIVQSMSVFGQELTLDTSATVAIGVSFTVTPQTASARINQVVDQGSSGCDVFATGTSRPHIGTFGEYPVMAGDDVNDGLTSVLTNVADNLDSMTVIVCLAFTDAGFGAPLVPINKIDYAGSFVGWLFESRGVDGYISDGSHYTGSGSKNPGPERDDKSHIFTLEIINRTTEAHWYMDGSNANEEQFIDAACGSYSTSEPIRIGYTNDDTHDFGMLHAVRIYSPALSSSDRAAVEAELAARYGITL